MKMKKFIAMAMAGACMVSAFAGCGSNTNSGAGNSSATTTTVSEGGSSTTASASDSTAAGSTEKTTFIVGFDQDFPPYGYVGDDGNYTGFDLEMAAKMCERLGWEIKYQPINWDAKDNELNSGAIDCIWNGFTMNGREDGYEWTTSYMDNSQVFVVKKDSGITGKDGLSGKVVMVQTDSAAETALKSDDCKDLLASFSNLMTTAQYNSAFMDLEAGAVDAVAMDIGVAQFQISGKEDKFIILDDHITDEQYGVGFKKGNTQLRDKVQTELENMVKDGTFAEISKKWFDRDVCTIKVDGAETAKSETTVAETTTAA